MTDIKAYSIKEFCKAHCISRSMYTILKRDKIEPEIIRIGKRILITVESAEKWLKDREDAYKNKITPQL